MPKPTPSQEENDLAAMGMTQVVKDYDGGGLEEPRDPLERPDPPPVVEHHAAKRKE